MAESGGHQEENMVSKEGAGRRDGGGRRSREEARLEILDAAEQFLRERPLRELTVADLMDRTSIGRSAFYVYFQDRYRLVAALLARLETDFVAAATPWLSDLAEPDPFSRLREALEATVGVWAEHGPVLRAIAEAAAQDHDVDQAYRWGLLERFIVAIAERIEFGRILGRIGNLDPRETAAALVLMNERYLSDRLGRSPQTETRQAVDTLYRIWRATLYGEVPGNLEGSGS
jgi:TetR/AcrR family transcriptional regulator, ethionamide resistance regulator